MTGITTTYLNFDQATERLYNIRGIYNPPKEEVDVWVNLYDDYFYETLESENEGYYCSFKFVNVDKLRESFMLY